MKKLIVLSGVGILLPFLAFAQNNSCSGGTLTGFQGLICKAGDIMSTLIPVLIILAVVYFIIGVIQYVISGDEEAKKKAKSHIIYGIIGLVVIVAMWGLVKIVTDTLGTQNVTPVLPVLPY